MKIKYLSYKPNSCEMCYFWHPTMKKCILDECHYILYEEEKKAMCEGCPYGRVYPCIGWCTRLILKK